MGKKKEIRTIAISSLVPIFVVALLLVLLPSQNIYAFRTIFETLTFSQKASVITAPTPAPFPINATQVSAPELTAEGVVIADVNSGTWLYEKNPKTQLAPASTTKIMTALVALEDYTLEDVVTINQGAIEGQGMDLVQGEKMTVENLLYGMLVHSANDAAFALAYHHDGGIEKFIERMNQKAQSLGLTQTHFTNPAGFDDPNHRTSARDLAVLSLFALKNPTLYKMVGVAQITVSDTEFTHFHALKNINKLLGVVPGVSGIKTGWTQEAGECLVSTALRGGHQVLFVVLRSEDRFVETEQLINWVFASHEWKTLTPTD